MLRLRSHLLPAVLTASPLAAASSLHRLLLYSTATSTATASATQFVVKDYLANSCGLTPAQARKASRRLSHLKSPSNPDVVRAFLAGTGITEADIARAVVRDSHILCSRVDKTLTPCIAHLRGIGLSPPQISRLIAINPNILVNPRMLVLELERVKGIVVCADMLRVPRNSAMFKYALVTIDSIGPGRIGARSDFLKKALGCSEAELTIAVRKLSIVLNISEGRMSRAVDFLKTEVGLEPDYILHRPSLLSYSVTRRLMPRHYVLKALKAKGLVEKNVDFFAVVCRTEKTFIKRFLDPYKESVPGLANAYAAACVGQVPSEIQP
ncbi:unnamed protein product [Urochloa decumbens]|uniref:Uncharacterized protein n=1 Tax=Urochloa decumbens TaxID=240449 RepID=A0ABC8ZW92_9POAL